MVLNGWVRKQGVDQIPPWPCVNLSEDLAAFSFALFHFATVPTDRRYLTMLEFFHQLFIVIKLEFIDFVDQALNVTHTCNTHGPVRNRMTPVLSRQANKESQHTNKHKITAPPQNCNKLPPK